MITNYNNNNNNNNNNNIFMRSGTTLHSYITN